MKLAYDHRLYEKSFGIHMPEVRGFLDPEYLSDYSLAMDAQPTLISVANAGVPAYMLNYVDPDFIRILVTPMNIAKITGEVKKGDWTTQTAQFPVVESTGEVSAYGDWNENGSVGQNINWVPRQSFLFQTMTQWGQLELDRAGEARIQYAANQNIASALALAKATNKSYAFGIEGLDNYGLLNDPSLSSPIAPAATGTSSGTLWSTKDGAAIYGDIVLLYGQLQSQVRGLIDREAPMTLAMSPEIEVNLTKTNQYNVNVTDQLKKNFPNLTIQSAVEYDTTGGELVQMVLGSIEGQQVVQSAFNEKMRAHPVVVGTSNYKQKKTSGTWGTIVRMPIGIAGMIGV